MVSNVDKILAEMDDALVKVDILLNRGLSPEAAGKLTGFQDLVIDMRTYLPEATTNAVALANLLKTVDRANTLLEEADEIIENGR